MQTNALREWATTNHGILTKKATVENEWFPQCSEVADLISRQENSLLIDK